MLENNARHPQDVGLLLFDLDDTIVQSGSYVSNRVLKALEQAHDDGYALSIASGRPLCSVNRALLKSGTMDYAVCSNGATVTRLSDSTTVCHRPLAQEDALFCYRMLAPYRPAWNAFFDDRALFEWKGASYMLTGRTGAVARASRYSSKGAGTLKRVARLMRRGMRYVWLSLTNKGHTQVRSILPALQRATNGVDKIGCTIPNEAECEESFLRLSEDGRFEVVRMGKTELEITAKGVTKGTGTRVLMDYLGLTTSELVAFGDGGNDLPLAEVVGRFVAMGNADDDVKAQADDVCPSVADDGVAVWIENNLLKGQKS